MAGHCFTDLHLRFTYDEAWQQTSYMYMDLFATVDSECHTDTSTSRRRMLLLLPLSIIIAEGKLDDVRLPVIPTSNPVADLYGNATYSWTASINWTNVVRSCSLHNARHCSSSGGKVVVSH